LTLGKQACDGCCLLRLIIHDRVPWFSEIYFLLRKVEYIQPENKKNDLEFGFSSFGASIFYGSIVPVFVRN
jgi:hypothetical protein